MLTLASSDQNDIGSVTVTIEAYLEDYPVVREATTFLATITECEVLELQNDVTENQIYELNAAALVFEISEFI
jgi:hypothetical protein